jgi:hypothetical protein
MQTPSNFIDYTRLGKTACKNEEARDRDDDIVTKPCKGLADGECIGEYKCDY